MGRSYSLFALVLLSTAVTAYAPDAEAKFISTDPIGYQDQFNLYAYCHNDPINCTDPNGEQAHLNPPRRPTFHQPGGGEEKVAQARQNQAFTSNSIASAATQGSNAQLADAALVTMATPLAIAGGPAIASAGGGSLVATGAGMGLTTTGVVSGGGQMISGDFDAAQFAQDGVVNTTIGGFTGGNASAATSLIPKTAANSTLGRAAFTSTVTALEAGPIVGAQRSAMSGGDTGALGQGIIEGTTTPYVDEAFKAARQPFE